ncbi:hypothetical protein AGMMS50276_31090 [Synergistales bacterium]|nr:hypothetical protein AGMMS50276_31090 [Synergistales bacterium]
MTHSDVTFFHVSTMNYLKKIIDVIHVVKNFALDLREEEDLTPEQIRVNDFLSLLEIVADYASDAMCKIDKFAKLAKDGAAK